jgi:hypothetical protein
VASPSLAVRIDLPAGLAPAAIPEVNASFETRSWSGVVNRSPGFTAEQATVASAGDGGPRARLTAERRRQEIRGTQREAVVFAADQVRLHLDARIDAPSMAVVTIPVEVPQACVIDRIELFEDDVLHPETAERGAIDIRWTRTAENGVAVVVQRPRAGRFRLEVDARLPGRPAVRGPLPSLRVAFTDGGRAVVDLQAEDGQWATVDGSSATAGGRNGVAHIELPAGAASPTYRLETSVPETPSATAEEGRPEPNGAVDTVAEPDGEGRVELADIRVAVDERGRTWGLASFELVAADQLLRVRLPQAWRLFDVLVDGRSADSVVPVVPEDDHVWEVRLLDAGWPRSVVVLFAGDLGRRLLDGEPLELDPPAIVGLPCRQVIWTMQVPAGISLRVAEPARLVTALEWQQERRAAQQRLVGDFQQAIDHASGVEQGRLRGFLQARGDAAASAADEPWTRTLMMQSASRPAAPPLAIVTSGQGEEGGGRITIRAVRQRDPSVPGRAVATLSLLACAGLAWIAGRRGVPRWLAVDAWLGPAIAVLLGLAWLMWLVPAWPGGILVAVGGWGLLQPWLRNARTAAGPRPPAPAANVAEATTMYRPPPAEGSTTHVAPKDTPPS